MRISSRPKNSQHVIHFMTHCSIMEVGHIPSLYSVDYSTLQHCVALPPQITTIETYFSEYDDQDYSFAFHPPITDPDANTSLVGPSQYQKASLGMLWQFNFLLQFKTMLICWTTTFNRKWNDEQHHRDKRHRGKSSSLDQIVLSHSPRQSWLEMSELPHAGC